MFTQGFLFGLAIAAPVGPIGLLCIQRSLNHGRFAGFISGLGAATADALYGSMAAFGLSMVTGFLLAQQEWLQLGGGLFIVYLGLRTLLAQRTLLSQRDAQLDGQTKLAGMYTSTLLLTLSNPVTILSFTAVFAGFGLGSGAQSPGGAAALVLGVFTGSALWWFTLSALVGLLRGRLQTPALRLINRTAGVMLLLFGMALLWRYFQH
ncbi:MAG: LysE family translocator [Anaerolinea sp.]|nr:LysE family translocator [Anaerolinea sp.]